MGGRSIPQESADAAPAGSQGDRIIPTGEAGAVAIVSAFDAASPPADPGDPGPAYDDAGGPPPPDHDDPGPADPGDGGGKSKRAARPKKPTPEEVTPAGLLLLSDDAGSLFRFNGRHWARLSETGRLALAYRCGMAFAKDREELVKHWLASNYREGLVWGRLPAHEVALANGVLDLESLALRPHDPEDYLDRTIPHDWRPDATAPFLEECLEAWFGSVEDDRVAALQEFIGYCLVSHARYKKALLLHGPSGTGKSRVVELITSLVGAAYRCSIPISQLDDDVRISQIVGKAVNSVTELPDGAMIKDGAFKTLVSTEEPVAINAKYLAPFTYVPTAKHVIATNTLPAIRDRSDATYARLLIVSMDRRLAESGMSAGEVDDRLRAEIEGVLVWAIEGARRLWRSQGVFTSPASSVELLKQYRDEQNPLEQFIAERCRRVEPSPSGRSVGVPTARFVEAFNAWHKFGRPWSTTRVSRTLKTMVPKIETENVWIGGRTVRCYVGVELLPVEPLPETVDIDAEGAGRARLDPDGDEVPVEPAEAGAG